MFEKSHLSLCGKSKEMNVVNHNIKIEHEKFGSLLNESFVNPGQFKLFLKSIQGCIELKNDFTFFDGVSFFVHIPYKHLVESIIFTKLEPYTLTDHLVKKSKIEAEVTK